MRRIVIGLVTVASVATLILAGAAGAAGRANELAAVPGRDRGLPTTSTPRATPAMARSTSATDDAGVAGHGPALREVRHRRSTPSSIHERLRR